MSFATRYGPWALVAGASAGLGAAFATELARRGLSVVAVARRREALQAMVASLPTPGLAVVADLATEDGLAEVLAACADRELGLVVANAAYSPIGAFVDLDPAESRRALAINCAAPVALAHALLPAMASRGRGGMVIMSSLAGMQGSPPISVYAATKAFGAVLAEGLWSELRPSGVDVVACVAGAVATPGLAGAKARPAPGTVTPDTVVAAALAGLGHGPRVVPGALMKVSSTVMSRLLPRRAAIALIARASRDLTPPS